MVYGESTVPVHCKNPRELAVAMEQVENAPDLELGGLGGQSDLAPHCQAGLKQLLLSLPPAKHSPIC